MYWRELSGPFLEAWEEEGEAALGGSGR